MNVEELVGTRVWVKCERFRSLSGIISSVPLPVKLDDLRSSVTKSVFKVDLHSGDVIQVLGSDICKFESLSL
jgi:hypothetical protein